MLHECYFDYLKLVIEFIFKVEVIFLQNSSSHISRKIFSISQTLKFPKLPFFPIDQYKIFSVCPRTNADLNYANFDWSCSSYIAIF